MIASCFFVILETCKQNASVLRNCVQPLVFVVVLSTYQCLFSLLLNCSKHANIVFVGARWGFCLEVVPSQKIWKSVCHLYNDLMNIWVTFLVLLRVTYTPS